MFSVKTNHPVAYDSKDHLYPEGVFWDNNVSLDFVRSVELYFGKKIDFMDQGCAGGALVVEMHKRGHRSLGLEGSDQLLNPTDMMLKEYGKTPVGFENWQVYGNFNLFTCDLSKEYEVFWDESPAKFDLITSWDVMEHFKPEDVDQVLTSVHKHLKEDGLFVASIAIFQSYRQPSPLGAGHLSVEHVEYHESVFPESWWLEKCDKYFERIDYPFGITNRGIHQHLLFCGRKK